ncbi:MAG: hypothetical protein IKB88_01260 [Clostridia bacterium]|nr:hypothetical protein [Clostridia bacterium]
MDTKLKSISKKKWVRTIAFVLAVIMFAFSGYFTSMFIKNELIYNSFDGRPYLQTAAFRDAVNTVESVAIYEGQSMVVDSIDEFEKTVYGAEIKNRYDVMKETAESNYDLLDKSGIGVYVTKNNKYRYRLMHNGVPYYFTYDGSLITEDEFNSYTYIRSNENATFSNGESIVVPEPTGADSVQSAGFVRAPEVTPVIAPVVELPEDETSVLYYENELNGVDMTYIHKISDALHFIFNTSYNGYNLNYGEISRDAFMLSIDNAYHEELLERYNESKLHSDGYFVLNRHQSVRYAVKFRNTGKVLTNNGVTATDNRQQILQKLGGELIESFENGKYIFAKEKMPRSDGFLAQLYYGIAEDFYYSSLTHLSTTDGAVEWAYFSYNPAMSDGDVLTVSENLFDAHTSKAKITRSVGFSLSAALIFFVLACATGIWLAASAGRDENGDVKICFYDKIPFEINLIFGLGIMALSAFGAVGLVVCEMFPSSLRNSGDFELHIAGILGTVSSLLSAILVAVFFTVPAVLTMSIARNVRAKTFTKHTLCRYIVMPVAWLFRKIKVFFNKLKFIFDTDYTKGKGKKFRVIACLSVALFFAINGILGCCAYAFGDGIGAFMLILAIIMDVAAVFICILAVVSLDRIMHTVSDIRHGDTDAKINTEHMPLFLKNFSDDIGSVGDGLRTAVDSAVRDQRMKAELITNVSHDLKTPLTSIVNYVDLLKRCNVEGEEANKYISILDEKAHRMKKLIEDLVEASKASSGAMEVHPIRVDLCEFALQTVGEHEDELKAQGIDIVLSLSEKNIYAMADPMKISRVVENLFSNIRKYALKGTRVYADVTASGEYAVMTIKNISRNALNVSADELMQRFVRGDSSRTGEGSGLGLSIAKNLCELQGGRFSVSVDGDLFKAVVELPLAK